MNPLFRSENAHVPAPTWRQREEVDQRVQQLRRRHRTRVAIAVAGVALLATAGVVTATARVDEGAQLRVGTTSDSSQPTSTTLRTLPSGVPTTVPIPPTRTQEPPTSAAFAMTGSQTTPATAISVHPWYALWGFQCPQGVGGSFTITVERHVDGTVITSSAGSAISMHATSGTYQGSVPGTYSFTGSITGSKEATQNCSWSVQISPGSP
jgi:hypothetical protein